MNEFVEIGGGILRLKDIRAVVPTFDDNTLVKFCDGTLDSFHEPYESVRDKLVGRPPKPLVDDRREEFAKQLMAHFRDEGLFAAANRINAFYQSTMLSETEGAG